MILVAAYDTLRMAFFLRSLGDIFRQEFFLCFRDQSGIRAAARNGNDVTDYVCLLAVSFLVEVLGSRLEEHIAHGCTQCRANVVEQVTWHAEANRATLMVTQPSISHRGLPLRPIRASLAFWRGESLPTKQHTKAQS